MGAMKRELERLANIVVYGNAETIEREFRKVEQLGGSLTILAQAVEMARLMSPLCECGADYHAQLGERFPEWIQDTNEQSEGETGAKIERVLSNAEDRW
jgi:hypothetical protein